MRIRLLVAAVVLCLALPLACAQVAVYGTFSANHLSGVDTGASFTSTGLQTNTDSFFANGFGAGVTLNFLHLGPARLGFDLRGSVDSGTPSAKTFLGGVKLELHPIHTHIKPYVQFSAGYLQTQTSFRGTDPPGPTVTNKYGAYEVIGGLDYSLHRFVDLRVVEIGVGRTFDPSIEFLNTADNATLFTINAGIVVHF
jgi:hypothetical protein